jgi:O-methyltransferase
MKPHELYPHIAGVAYSTRETLQNSFDLGFSVGALGIEGDIVECGIAAGANFAMMIHGCLKAENYTNRRFWGYDSFEGIQLAGSKDTEQAGIGEITHDVNVPESELLKSSGITVHSKESVTHNLVKWFSPHTNWKLVKGWVQNTIPYEAPDSISILRLDMDVYDPTMFALRQLYDKVSKGGYIIIDDWALAGVRTAVMEFWTERGLKPEIKAVPNSTPIYWIKS